MLGQACCPKSSGGNDSQGLSRVVGQSVQVGLRHCAGTQGHVPFGRWRSHQVHERSVARVPDAERLMDNLLADDIRVRR